MKGGTQGERWITYCLMAVALLLIVFGGWRLFVSQFGTPEQFLWFDPADKVKAMDQAVANFEQLADRVGPQGKDRQGTEENLRQLKALRERLVQDRDARIPEGRRTERSIGVISIMAGAALFGWGIRRSSRSGSPT